MKGLTKAEEELMQFFWTHGPSTVSEIIGKMNDPKPPHSTISSIARILEKKGFLNHKAYGRTYLYLPTVDKKSYSKFSVKNLVRNYFEGSMNELVSFLIEEKDLSLSDLNLLLKEQEKEND